MKYEAKYYVNEEKRTIVCTIECSEWDAFDYLEKSDIVISVSGPRNTLYKYGKMPSKFVGIAKCAPGDKFDEHIGRLLAFNRAKGKYDHAFETRVVYLVSQWDRLRQEVLERLLHYNKKAAYHQSRRSKEIEEYLNK